MKVTTSVNIPSDLIKDFFEGGTIAPYLWLCEITWEDITEHGETWIDVDTIDEWLSKTHKFTCVSTGYILRINEKGLVYCNTFSKGGVGKEEDEVAGLNVIPIGAIKKVKKVKRFNIVGSLLDAEA